MTCITPASPPTVLAGLVTPDPDRARRLCITCYGSIDRQKDGLRLTRVLSLVMGRWYQINDAVMCRLACVCRNWRGVAGLFRQKFHRLVRSRLTSDTRPPASPSERAILRANATLCMREYPQALPRIAAIMDEEPGDAKPRMGSYRLDVATAIHALEACNRAQIARKGGRGPAMKTLYQDAHKAIIDLSNQRSASCLTRLSFLPDNYTLRMFLLSHCAEIQFRMFWLLRVYRPDMASWLVANVGKITNRRIADSLTVAHLLTSIVKEEAPDTRGQLVRTWVSVHGKRGAWFPGLPGRVFLNVDARTVSTIKSNSMPVVVPCLLQDVDGRRGVVNILYKHESVLNDATMMDCLGVCARTLARQRGRAAGPGVVRYAVVPLRRDAGLVAMVPKSRTLHGIAQTGVTLQNHLLERNKGQTVDRIRRSFLESAALCCVQSMLFGLGDRHLENILLTDSGVLFHVDYAYMFGREPSGKQIMASKNRMKITPSMVDILGGEGSSYYTLFRERTAEIGGELRLRANLFSVLCESTFLAERHLKKRRQARERILRHLYTAFRPGQTIQETEIQILNLVQYNTRHRAFDAVLDRLHNACVKFF